MISQSDKERNDENMGDYESENDEDTQHLKFIGSSIIPIDRIITKLIFDHDNMKRKSNQPREYTCNSAINFDKNRIIHP